MLIAPKTHIETQTCAAQNRVKGVSEFLWQFSASSNACNPATRAEPHTITSQARIGVLYNRIYDINTGRWTTPDPAASPYWNLQDYVGGNPISRSDPSGLSCEAFLGKAAAKYLDKYINGHSAETITGSAVEKKMICKGIKKYKAKMGKTSASGDRAGCYAQLRRGESLYCDGADSRETNSSTSENELDRAKKANDAIMEELEHARSGWDEKEGYADEDLEIANTRCDEDYAICLRDAAKTYGVAVLAATAVGAVCGSWIPGLGTAAGAALGAAGGLAIATANFIWDTEDCEDKYELCKRRAQQDYRKTVDRLGNRPN